MNVPQHIPNIECFPGDAVTRLWFHAESLQTPMTHGTHDRWASAPPTVTDQTLPGRGSHGASGFKVRNFLRHGESPSSWMV